MRRVGKTLYTLKTDLAETGDHDDGEDENTERFETKTVKYVA